MRADFVMLAYGPGREELGGNFIQGGDRDGWVAVNFKDIPGAQDVFEASIDNARLDFDELVDGLKLLTSDRPGCRVTLLARETDSDETRKAYVAAGISHESGEIDENIRNQNEIFETLEKGDAIPQLTLSSLLVITGPLAEEFPKRVFNAFPIMKDARVLERTEGYMLAKLEDRPFLDGQFRETIQQMAKAFPENSFQTHTYMEEDYGKEIDPKDKAYARTSMLGYMQPFKEILALPANRTLGLSMSTGLER